jgi:hypothetical protein
MTGEAPAFFLGLEIDTSFEAAVPGTRASNEL